jgi:hypothetical protein
MIDLGRARHAQTIKINDALIRSHVDLRYCSCYYEQYE